MMKNSIKMASMTSFAKKVYEVVSKISKGKVLTYKQVAELAGKPKAYRAVGNILHNNPNLIKVPCHRVIRSDGSLGGYAKGDAEKRRLLEQEGVGDIHAFLTN